jgi:hypothetical protein
MNINRLKKPGHKLTRVPMNLFCIISLLLVFFSHTVAQSSSDIVETHQ